MSYEFELCKKSNYTKCKHQIENIRLADFVCSKSTMTKLAKSTVKVKSQVVKNRDTLEVRRKWNIRLNKNHIL
jgi:hypothetical protein